MSWLDQPIHIVDFEGNPAYGIVEYGIVSLMQGAVVSTYTRCCKAKQPISLKDTKVHGIATEDVIKEAPFDKDWDLFSSLRSQGPFGAHHAPFEDMLLTKVWPFCSKAPAFLKNQPSCLWGPWVDSCALYRKIFPGLESYKLGALIEAFKLESKVKALSEEYCPKHRQKYHCALFDALASAVLLIHLSEFKDIKDQSLEWLLLTSMVSSNKGQTHRQLDLFS